MLKCEETPFFYFKHAALFVCESLEAAEHGVTS